VRAEEEVGNDVEAGAMRGADEGYGMTQLAGKGQRVQIAAARFHLIGHVQQHQRGQTDGEDRRGQHQLTIQVRGVEYKQDAIGLGYAGHLAGEHIDGDARVLRVGGERIDAGQIDEREVVAADRLHAAGVVFHRDAGIVRDLLAQAGEPVEEGGLAGVGRADERDRAQGRLLAGGWRCWRWVERFENGGVAAHAASPAESLRKMRQAVSLRRATSTPSRR
jgi:hypothetical protein